MRTYLSLLKTNTLPCLGVIAIILTIGHASAANRIFPLYLKNGFNHDVTFIVEPGNCYQGTGSADPSKLIHGPIPPGGSVSFDVAGEQKHGCPSRDGVFLC
jgi:hypothetical protein